MERVRECVRGVQRHILCPDHYFTGEEKKGAVKIIYTSRGTQLKKVYLTNLTRKVYLDLILIRLIINIKDSNHSFYFAENYFVK